MRRDVSRWRISMVFWNQHISWRATVPGWYFQVFFSFPAVKNSFLRAFPPTVGWSFFLAGSSPPSVEGLALAAILANYQDGDNCGDLPASSRCSASATLLLISSWSGGVSCAGAGGSTGMEDSWGWACTSALVLIHCQSPFSPFLGVIFVLTMLEFRRESWPIKKQYGLGLSLVRAHVIHLKFLNSMT